MHDIDNKNISLVIDALNKHNVDFWLDHGTLLGYVREKELIPWDTDFDISVWKNDYDKLDESFISIFLSEGWTVYIGKEKIKLFPLNYEQIMDIDIGRYSMEGDETYLTYLIRNESKFAKISVAIIKTMGTQGKDKYRRVVQLKDKSITAFIIALVFTKTLNILPKSMRMRITGIMDNKVRTIRRVTVPRELLEPLIKVVFINREVSIPENHEAYLEFKYGPDWRMPRKEYRGITDFLTK